MLEGDEWREQSERNAVEASREQRRIILLDEILDALSLHKQLWTPETYHGLLELVKEMRTLNPNFQFEMAPYKIRKDR